MYERARKRCHGDGGVRTEGGGRADVVVVVVVVEADEVVLGRACSAGRFTCQSKTHHVRTADSTPQRLPIRHEFETACTARCHIQTDCLSLNYVGPIARRSDMPPTDSIWTHAQPPCCPLSNAFKAATRAYRHLANGSVIRRNRQTDGRTDRSIALCLYRRVDA